MLQVAVVDDEVEFIVLVEELLAVRGWEVSAYLTTANLLPLLRRKPPDIIILDLRVNGDGDGWEQLDRLHRDPILYAIPVIICSAAVDEIRASAAMLADRGIPALEKPFEIEDLYTTLDVALRSSREKTDRKEAL